MNSNTYVAVVLKKFWNQKFHNRKKILKKFTCTQKNQRSLCMRMKKIAEYFMIFLQLVNNILALFL